ncbi:MAG: hypothetical protein CMG66_03510 [Candidatus Marinimicrobia bacterium]|nr:hypothetical protein [Candidatus Neomarinimicrobiota bacterium]
MKFPIKYLIIYIIILFSSCASIKAPAGGPIDSTPPVLLFNEIIPKKNFNLKEKQSIKLFFNERINPNTTLGAIYIEPEIDISINVSNNFITIKPKEKWPNQFRVFISRTITDYFNNQLQAPIDLLFSRLDTIYNNKISGQLFNIDTTKIYEVALLDDNLSVISKTQSNSYGKYTFSGLQNYDFSAILAIENQISDNIFTDIRNKKYGISMKNIALDDNFIFISDPIYRPEINSVNLINSKYGQVGLTNNTYFEIIFNNPYLMELAKKSNNYLYFNHDFNDSLFIDMMFKNHLETYSINKHILLSDTVIDTLSPSISSKYLSEDSLFIEFSEPVLITPSAANFYYLKSDTVKSNIFYQYINPKLIYLDNSYNSDIIYVDCTSISDLENNFLCDSLLSINNIFEEDTDDIIHGQINGSILYSGDKSLIVQAKNLETEKNIYQRVNNNIFNFKRLIQGYYQITVYEDINPISEVYFSGTLEPLKLAANFLVYHKDVYVRENWSNSITLEFK